ncbi:hypothetical protein B6175_00190 [Staphylococcus aureus]|nr:hypothetical protein B6175_00190 [Staphylococcus aureus]
MVNVACLLYTSPSPRDGATEYKKLSKEHGQVKEKYSGLVERFNENVNCLLYTSDAADDGENVAPSRGLGDVYKRQYRNNVIFILVAERCVEVLVCMCFKVLKTLKIGCTEKPHLLKL